MDYGFVYLLSNPVMPGIYKIGKTERSPYRRCEELSSSTSAPVPFELLAYFEHPEHSKVEKMLHENIFAKHRINPQREFFHFNPDEGQDDSYSLEQLVQTFLNFPGSVSVASPGLAGHLNKVVSNMEEIEKIRKEDPFTKEQVMGILMGLGLSTTETETQ